jgi:hypothetical protein
MSFSDDLGLLSVKLNLLRRVGREDVDRQGREPRRRRVSIVGRIDVDVDEEEEEVVVEISLRVKSFVALTRAFRSVFVSWQILSSLISLWSLFFPKALISSLAFCGSEKYTAVFVRLKNKEKGDTHRAEPDTGLHY